MGLKGGNEERRIISKWPAKDVEALAAAINEDHVWDFGTIRVVDHLGKQLFDKEGVPIVWARVGVFIQCKVLWCTADKTVEVEGLTVVEDLRGERKAFGGVESGSGEVEVVLEASAVKVDVVAGGGEGPSVFGFQGV
jgi:hypothetical protein